MTHALVVAARNIKCAMGHQPKRKIEVAIKISDKQR